MTDINSKIKDNNSKDPVVLYMKGNPTFPQCGFSSTVVQILKHIGVNFESYDVLQDENLREGIKSFSNWPTIPQLYVNNEFVGGCDIIREMFESGELKEYFIKNMSVREESFLIPSELKPTFRNNHLQYAITWFLMSFAFFVLFLVYLKKNK